jgi:predicted dehydrogenase
MSEKLHRRNFLIESGLKLSGLGVLPVLSHGSSTKYYREKSVEIPVFDVPRLKFGVIGINHSHIFGMAASVIRGGGEMLAFHANEDDLAADFQRRFPEAKRVKDKREILDNKEIDLVLSSIIPNQRGPLGVEVMKHGKDYMVDKPGITDLKHLKEIKKVQKETGRIFSISYSERFENRATMKASELI